MGKYLVRFSMMALLGSVFLFSTSMAQAKTLRYDLIFVLEVVLDKMGKQFDPQKPLPDVFFESQIPLRQFQDAVEPQWGMRPDFVLNAYIVTLNEIYLLDDPTYYKKTNRYIEDSLVHELVHYVQVMYSNASLADGGDYLELQAVEIQTWFRETYLRESTVSAL
ncbi:MAG: hypothetical protein M9899_03805 [Bdellovibrionaceae bacterium]|nr:hypothetical protein [Pseudobdellovibrionaceae bacterium]